MNFLYRTFKSERETANFSYVILLLSGIQLQAFPVDNNSIFYILLYVVPFFLFFFYGSRLQTYNALREIGSGLNKLKVMKDKARKEAIDYLVNVGKAPTDPAQRVDQFLDYVTIMPVDMDPAGLVGKLDHVVSTNNDRVRAEVGALLNQNNPVTVSISENLLEVATSLNQIHKIVRHFYLLGKKTNSYFTLIQLQMLMPMIIQEADALLNAVDSFKMGQPVGDGIGPVVVSRYMAGKEKRVVAKD